MYISVIITFIILWYSKWCEICSLEPIIIIKRKNFCIYLKIVCIWIAELLIGNRKNICIIYNFIRVRKCYDFWLSYHRTKFFKTVPYRRNMNNKVQNVILLDISLILANILYVLRIHPILVNRILNKQQMKMKLKN